MKRKITVSITLIMSIVLVSLMSSDSQAQGQGNRRAVFDTGVVTLGPNQILRITLTLPPQVNASLNFEEIKFTYLPGPCTGGVCKLSASNPQSSRGQINEGEAVSIDIPPSGAAVRGIIRTNNRNAHVTAMIVDTTTGNTVSLVSASDADTW